jgi:hypothetical protein
VVGELDALGRARRAGGVDERREVVTDRQVASKSNAGSAAPASASRPAGPAVGSSTTKMCSSAGSDACAARTRSRYCASVTTSRTPALESTYSIWLGEDVL